jgi:hypothetical protein
MPSFWSGYECDDRSKWPVKVYRGGCFSSNKKLELEYRYARRRIRVEFRSA